MIVYKTTNLVNGKIYVGKDRYNNPKYMGGGKLIKLAIKKYGKVNFIKEIIEECDNLDILAIRELYWINLLKATNLNIGYNISTRILFNGLNGGSRNKHGENNPMWGKCHSEETKKQFRDLKRLRDYNKWLLKYGKIEADIIQKKRDLINKNKITKDFYFYITPSGKFTSESKARKASNCTRLTMFDNFRNNEMPDWIRVKRKYTDR